MIFSLPLRSSATNGKQEAFHPSERDPEKWFSEKITLKQRVRSAMPIQPESIAF
jgi:hypothetical protein